MNSAQSQFDVLPSYAAPAGGRLTDEMLDIYDKAGVILLREFVSAKACKALRERGQDLLCSYSPRSECVSSDIPNALGQATVLILGSYRNQSRIPATPKIIVIDNTVPLDNHNSCQ